MMKNLLYTIADHKYKPLTEVCIKTIRKYNPNLDICCITPLNVLISDTFSLLTSAYDYKYTSRFTIFQWDQAQDYDNFLYIDTDIICCQSLDKIFDIINLNPDIIHSVKEKEHLNKADSWHKFSNECYGDDIHAYNNGTFGFNKKLLPIIKEFLSYVIDNKHLASCDQALFNEFFNKRKLLQPTLSPYVSLMSHFYTAVNPTKQEDIILKHYLGGFESGNMGGKLNDMNRDAKL